MIIDPDFQEKISYLDLESLENSDDTICIVDAGMILKGYNPAWVRFAEKNGGSHVPVQFPIGSEITAVGEEPLKSSIKSGYENALNEEKPFELVYECSSGSLFRLFKMTAYPLLQARGLVISHHLVRKKPHEASVHEFSQQFYQKNNLVIQCQNCRRIKDPESRNRWLWVPSLVKSPLREISHSICDRCLDFYFPDLPHSVT